MIARGSGVVLAAALFMAVLAVPARAAEVHVNINIGGPPPIFLHSRPHLVYLPQPAVYVAVGIPYDVFYVSGRYYYYRGNDWYWGPGYGGPWKRVVYKSLPPGLRKYKVDRLREYRDIEYRSQRVYRRDDYRRDDYREYRDSRDSRYISDNSSKARNRGKGRGRR
jgi:hypothetical protein